MTLSSGGPNYGGNRHMHAERFSKSKPVFLLEKDELVLTNWPVPREQAPEEPSVLREFHNRARRLSKLYQQGARALALLTTDSGNDDGQQQLLEGQRNLRDPSYRATLHVLGETIVNVMYQESLEAGARFVLDYRNRRASRRGY